MSGILYVAGIPGLISNREPLYTTVDTETQEWTAICASWYSAHGEHPITARDVLTVIKSSASLLDLWAGRSALAAQQRVGHALKARRDRVYGAYQIRHGGQDSITGNAVYYIFNLETGPDRNTRNTGDQLQKGRESPRCFAEYTPQNTPTRMDTTPGVSGVSGVLDKSSAENVCRSCGQSVPDLEVAKYLEAAGEVICIKCDDGQ
jgi:hypothetical protein